MRAEFNVDVIILPRLETFNKIRPRKNRGKEQKKMKILRRRPRRRNRAAVFPFPFGDDAQKRINKINVFARRRIQAPFIYRRSLRNDQTVDQPNRAVGVGGLRHIVRNHYNR